MAQRTISIGDAHAEAPAKSAWFDDMPAEALGLRVWDEFFRWLVARGCKDGGPWSLHSRTFVGHELYDRLLDQVRVGLRKSYPSATAEQIEHAVTRSHQGEPQTSWEGRPLTGTGLFVIPG